MKKKYRLKGWVKELLLILVVGFFLTIIVYIGLKEYSRKARECDAYYGRTCSSYEVNQYGKGVRRK